MIDFRDWDRTHNRQITTDGSIPVQPHELTEFRSKQWLEGQESVHAYASMPKARIVLRSSVHWPLGLGDRFRDGDEG